LSASENLWTRAQEFVYLFDDSILKEGRLGFMTNLNFHANRDEKSSRIFQT